mgnify:CR=1 FL=1
MVLKLLILSPCSISLFENDVKMYGTQTLLFAAAFAMLFENDVKMYGTQTNLEYFLLLVRLRMM